MTTEPIVSFDDALSALRREYFSHVRDSAKELAEACRNGEIEDRESLLERVHEECDGDGWVIYTQKAQIVLLVSDNDSAGMDSLGADGFDWSGGVPWSQLAYFAMEADLLDAIDHEDIDVNDDSGWRTEEEADDDE